jgi:hypothetical protein
MSKTLRQIPLKEIFSKKPMKLDSAFKTRSQQVKVRTRNGISSMVRYNYDEYTMEQPKHGPTKTRVQEYGFMVYAGKSASKTGFSYILTDHRDDTAWINSAIVMNTEFTRAYFSFNWSSFELEVINQSTDIYTSNLVFNNDTTKWEILVMDKLRFKESILPVVTGEIKNEERRFMVRLVAEFEDGAKAQFAPPGFEVIEDGNILMAVQFQGYPERLPVIWLDRDLDRHLRFVLITSASSLIERLIEVVQLADQ